MRWTVLLMAIVIVGGALAVGDEKRAAPGLDAAWFGAEAWDDGAAQISVFRGRIKWYGQWRDAEVRHYLVREYLDPEELTKRDREQGNVPVIKANTLVSFTTGTYQYRQMSTLFFDRRDGSLVKAVGSSQEGCGASFQRWDRVGSALVYDTYWEGEGSGRRSLAKQGATFFAEELPFVAGAMKVGAQVELLPSIVSSSVRDRGKQKALVAREGQRVRVGQREYAYDKGGFIEGWTVPGAQEFRRVSKRKLYYWQFSKNGDEKLLEAK